MVWCRVDDKPLSEPKLVWFTDTYVARGGDNLILNCITRTHDDVMKWKHFSRYWPFVWGIHWSLVNSPDKGHWRGTLMVSLICAWINRWVNNREAGDLRHHCTHYDTIVMCNVSIFAIEGPKMQNVIVCLINLISIWANIGVAGDFTHHDPYVTSL